MLSCGLLGGYRGFTVNHGGFIFLQPVNYFKEFCLIVNIAYINDVLKIQRKLSSGYQLNQDTSIFYTNLNKSACILAIVWQDHGTWLAAVSILLF